MYSFRNKTTKIHEALLLMYEEKMKEVKFMTEYISDIPEIFETDNMKCKLFLIKIFGVLNPSFHYLSFMSQDAVDLELTKIASILQILPCDHRLKNFDLLQNMNESTAHNFWIRFFNLCKMHSTLGDSHPNHKESHKKKFHSRFADITEALHNINYDISMISTIKLKQIDINQEINLWNDTVPLKEETMPETSVNSFSITELKEKSLPEMNNLVNSINYIQKKIDYENQSTTVRSSNFGEFFCNFNNSVNEMSIFKNNLKFVTSLVIENIINTRTLYFRFNWSLYKVQIEHCNNLIKIIKNFPNSNAFHLC